MAHVLRLAQLKKKPVVKGTATLLGAGLNTNLCTETLLFFSSAAVFFHPSSVLTQL